MQQQPVSNPEWVLGLVRQAPEALLLPVGVEASRRSRAGRWRATPRRRGRSGECAIQPWCTILASRMSVATECGVSEIPGIYRRPRLPGARRGKCSGSSATASVPQRRKWLARPRDISGISGTPHLVRNATSPVTKIPSPRLWPRLPVHHRYLPEWGRPGCRGFLPGRVRAGVDAIDGGQLSPLLPSR